MHIHRIRAFQSPLHASLWVYYIGLLSSMFHNLVFVCFRNALKRAHITGSCYVVGHAFVYFAHAAGFQFGAYLIQAGRMTPEGMFT